jgi:hypothetical protein
MALNLGLLNDAGKRGNEFCYGCALNWPATKMADAAFWNALGKEKPEARVVATTKLRDQTFITTY